MTLSWSFDNDLSGFFGPYHCGCCSDDAIVLMTSEIITDHYVPVSVHPSFLYVCALMAVAILVLNVNCPVYELTFAGACPCVSTSACLTRFFFPSSHRWYIQLCQISWSFHMHLIVRTFAPHFSWFLLLSTRKEIIERDTKVANCKVGGFDAMYPSTYFIVPGLFQITNLTLNRSSLLHGDDRTLLSFSCKFEIFPAALVHYHSSRNEIGQKTAYGALCVPGALNLAKVRNISNVCTDMSVAIWLWCQLDWLWQRSGTMPPPLKDRYIEYDVIQVTQRWYRLWLDRLVALLEVYHIGYISSLSNMTGRAPQWTNTEQC